MLCVRYNTRGFTLIELSIVLVIIGLIVGGILVGQDLIKNAEGRAQISQIEKYNQAVNTFRAKFGALPGDMPPSIANQFGFALGTGCDGSQEGYRNGDGLISGTGLIMNEAVQEDGLFWVDLSSASAGSLIDGSFPNSGAYAVGCTVGPANGAGVNTTPGTSYIGDYVPLAKIGHGNFIAVAQINGFDWYMVSAFTQFLGGGAPRSNVSIPVFQAYQIDSKIDDGLPISGAVQTYYLGGGSWTIPNSSPSWPVDNTNTCYNSTSNIYSISSLANYGAGGNCALMFRFQ